MEYVCEELDVKNTRFGVVITSRFLKFPIVFIINFDCRVAKARNALVKNRCISFLLVVATFRIDSTTD